MREQFFLDWLSDLKYCRNLERFTYQMKRVNPKTGTNRTFKLMWKNYRSVQLVNSEGGWCNTLCLYTLESLFLDYDGKNLNYHNAGLYNYFSYIVPALYLEYTSKELKTGVVKKLPKEKLKESTYNGIYGNWWEDRSKKKNYKVASKIKKAKQIINNKVIIDVPKNTSIYPKHFTSYFNRVNEVSQATRPKNVGQLTEIFKEFQKNHVGEDKMNVETWEAYYKRMMPGAIDRAYNILWAELKKSTSGTMLHYSEPITTNLVRSWVRDLIINKTFDGLCMQKPIFDFLSEQYNEPFRASTPKDESSGIDGFIGNQPYSIKPKSYNRCHLNEELKGHLVTYEKIGNKIHIQL